MYKREMGSINTIMEKTACWESQLLMPGIHESKSVTKYINKKAKAKKSRISKQNVNVTSYTYNLPHKEKEEKYTHVCDPTNWTFEHLWQPCGE